jgi:predicted  nucleic acid-binding Zn-ribbon protein
MAAKNPRARPMSTQQAEVTWLAYNYDILRYLLGAQMTVVDYAEWFGDPLVIGRRLERLGLPGFSVQREFADCVGGIVNQEFRHQMEGRGEAVSSIPLAQSLFEDLAALARSEGPQTNERLGRYVSVLDIVFRAITPFGHLLSDVPALRTDLRDSEATLARLASQCESLAAQVEDGQGQLAALRTERDGARVRAKKLAGEIAAEREAAKVQTAELAAQIARTRTLHNETQTRLKAAVATERERAARFEKYASSLRSEHAANSEKAGLRIAELESALGNMKAQVDQAAKDWHDLSAKLEQVGRDKEDLSAKLRESDETRQKLEPALRDLESAHQNLKREHLDLQAQMEALKQRRWPWR